MPEAAGRFDGIEHLAGTGESAFEEVDAAEEPEGQILVDKAVEYVTALAPLLDEAVRAEDGEILADSGVADAKEFLDGIDVEFAIAQLDDDADAVRVGDGAEQFGELPGDDGSGGNGGLSCVS